MSEKQQLYVTGSRARRLLAGASLCLCLSLIATSYSRAQTPELTEREYIEQLHRAPSDALHRRYIAFATKLYGADGNDTVHAKERYADYLSENERYVEALKVRQEIYRSMRTWKNISPGDLSIAHDDAISLCEELNDQAALERELLTAIKTFREFVTSDSYYAEEAAKRVSTFQGALQYLYNDAGRYDEAIALNPVSDVAAFALEQKKRYTEAEAIWRKSGNRSALARNLELQDRFAEAEGIWRSMEGEEVTLAANLEHQGKYAEAEPIWRDRNDHVNLSRNLKAQKKYAEAAAEGEKASQPKQATAEEQAAVDASLRNIEGLLAEAKKTGNREDIAQYQNLLTSAKLTQRAQSGKSVDPNDPAMQQMMKEQFEAGLAYARQSNDRELIAMYESMAAASEYGKIYQQSGAVRPGLDYGSAYQKFTAGDLYFKAGQYPKAVELLRDTCPSLLTSTVFSEQVDAETLIKPALLANPETAKLMEKFPADAIVSPVTCFSEFATAEYMIAGKGPVSDKAFQAAQQAIANTPGAAMTRTAARALARDRGAAANLTAIDQLSQKMVDATAPIYAKLPAFDPETSGTDVEYLQVATSLIKEMTPLQASISKETEAILQHTPEYRDLIMGAPVSLDELQSAAGNKMLLRSDEALVLWMLTEDSRPLVFAVSQRSSGWAEVPLTAEELIGIVRDLRDNIDPCGYDGSGTGCGRARAAFNSELSHRLYKALLGAPAIQAVISPSSVKILLIVPSGALATLPPAALITNPGAAPEWLIDRYALAIVPSAAALKTRRMKNEVQGVGSTAFFGFANPAFSHGAPPAYCATQKTKSAPQVKMSGQAAKKILDSLCPLSETENETLQVARTLGASTDSVYLGERASEEFLYSKAGAAVLRDARVVSFSTHALIYGDFNLDEPALALSAPAAGSKYDGLLKASEAAQLKLSADWVLLSACNTAAPSGEGGAGLTGLAKSFLSAGAKSLLVSNWRVQDDTGRYLVTRTFELLQQDASLSRAASLRQAMLDVKKNPAHQNPFHWAAFTYIGTP